MQNQFGSTVDQLLVEMKTTCWMEIATFVVSHFTGLVIRPIYSLLLCFPAHRELTDCLLASEFNPDRPDPTAEDPMNLLYQLC